VRSSTGTVSVISTTSRSAGSRYSSSVVVPSRLAHTLTCTVRSSPAAVISRQARSSASASSSAPSPAPSAARTKVCGGICVPSGAVHRDSASTAIGASSPSRTIGWNSIV
jgi:hypothetical protein